MTHDHFIDLETERLPVIVTKRTGARRMVLRYQPLRHALSLTLPRYVSIKQGLRFAHSKRDWIERQLRRKAPRIAFADGTLLPILGVPHTIRHHGGRGVAEARENVLYVPGEAQFLERRVKEWLIKRCREEILSLATMKAHAIRVQFKKISLRDTTSCWGSCTSDGNLSFSWRVIFAPYHVLEALVSHEVAHLKEHNHSAAFWTLVSQLSPGYEQADRWLKAHGSTLYAYG